MFPRRAPCRPPRYSRFLGTSPTTEPPTLQKKSARPTISTAVVVNRSPFLTRVPSEFEAAYYAYQGRLRRALHNPFPLDFYFKEGSILETRFTLEERKRERDAFGPTFGIDDDRNKEKAEAARAAVEQLAEQEGEHEEMMPRQHPSDISGDTKSLDRSGTRNLYLLVQDNHQVWRFPQGDVEKQELLHQAAQRNLYAECNNMMDTWIVSRTPIGVYHPAENKSTFLYKAHIMAGQIHPTAGIKDFAWLTKEEIEAKVDQHFWEGVKDVLSDY